MRRTAPRGDHAPIPCVRCGAVGVAVWKACSDTEWRVVCADCDIEANEVLLRWLKVPRSGRKLADYLLRQDRTPITRHRLKMSGLVPLV